MSRYSVCSEWTTESLEWVEEFDKATGMVADVGFALQYADAKDDKTGDIFRQGAYRVTKNGKPVGRTFFGESAWSDAQRLFFDVGFKARRTMDHAPWAPVLH